MTDIGLAEKTGRGEIGRAGPHLDRIAAAPEADDELVVGDFRPGAAKGDPLVIDRKTRRLHGGFIGLSGRVGRVVIDDLDVDATVDGSLELGKDRRVGEFVRRNTKTVAGRRPLDVVQARFEQAAREPNDLRIRRIVEVLRRRISKLLGELLARDGTAIEPYAVARAFFPFLLSLNLELELVLWVAGERAGLAVHRHDPKSIGGAGRRGVVAPQEALDREVLGVEALRLARIVRIERALRIGNDRLEHFLRAQPFRAGAAGAKHLALEREPHKALAALFGAVQRDQYGMSAAVGFCLKALRRGRHHAHCLASMKSCHSR